jgi:biopolymer transport protein ExbB/TolQ
MHPVEYVITGMFFIGLAGLIVKIFCVRIQWSKLRTGPILEKMGNIRLDCRETPRLLEQVRLSEQKHGISLYTNRLYNLLVNIKHAESVEKLDEDFRFYADDDFTRAESDYGLTKMIIWAIPILGFLGTVVGIALAMGNLTPEALEESLPNVMGGLTVAFDTTAQALAMSMVIYFGQFLIWRDEQKLLDEISRFAERELRGRFENVSNPADSGQLRTVRKMLEQVLGNVEKLIVRQSEIWDQAMNAANSRFSHIVSESSAQIQSALITAMREGAESHAYALAKAEQHLLAETRENVFQLMSAADSRTEKITELQQGIVQQAEVIRQVLQATGEVTQLEERLNQNLAVLAGASHFEETVNSLAAVIHLLNTKLTTLPGGTPVQLPQSPKGKGKGQAA